jgi:hypothetical protein
VRRLRAAIPLLGTCVVVASFGAACSTVLGLTDVPTPLDASVEAGDGGGVGGDDETSPPVGEAGADSPLDAPVHDASVEDTLPGADAEHPPDATTDVGSPGSEGGSPDAPSDAPPDVTTHPPDGGTPVSLTDCVLLMHMDETTWSGAGSVIDSSGTGNNGSPMGDATTTASGKFGRAALFSGTGYVNVADSASLHPTTALTYAAWFYSTGFTSDTLYPGIIAKRDDYAVNVGFTMFLWTGNTLWADLADQYGSRFNSTATFTNGQWYHVALVYDGSTTSASIYVNGALDSVHSVGANLTASTAALTIGFLPQGTRVDSTAYFIGRIDEVAIWNRALSPGEIQSLASATGPL